MRCFALVVLLVVSWWSMPSARAQSTPVWTTQVFSSPIGQFIFSADSTRIVVVSNRKDSLAVVDAVTGSVLWSRGCRAKKYLTRVALSPDGESIAVLEDDGFITRQVVYVLNAATGELVNETSPLEKTGSDPLFDSMVFAPDNRGLYLAQRKNHPEGPGIGPWTIGFVRLWDFFTNIYTDTVQLQLKDYRWLGNVYGDVTHIDMYLPPETPDTLLLFLSYRWAEGNAPSPPDFIITSGYAHQLLVYSVTERKAMSSYTFGLDNDNAELLSALFSPQSQLLVFTQRSAGSIEHHIHDGGTWSEELPTTYSYGVFDPVSGTAWYRSDRYAYSRCFLANDNYVLLNDLNVWDYRRDAVVFQLPLSNRATSTCLPLPNANYLLLAGADDMTAGIYNVAELRWEETYGSTHATAAALSPTFTAFATGSSTGTVSLWQTKNWSSFSDPSVRAEFHIAATSGTTVAGNQPVTFANASYPLSTNAQFVWDFGDGSEPSNEFQPVHIFTEYRSYVIQLIVDNENDDRDTVVKLVVVEDIPTLSIQPEATPAVGKTLLVVPNPAGNDGCRISFSLSQPSTVRISIANVLGAKVATPLLATVLQAGTHDVEWRTCSHGELPAPGLYYALVQIEQESFVMPICVLR